MTKSENGRYGDDEYYKEWVDKWRGQGRTTIGRQMVIRKWRCIEIVRKKENR